MKSFKKNKDLNWYKKNIPLVDFILYTNKGYYLDKKSTKSNPKLFLPKRDINNEISYKKNGTVEKESVLVFKKSKTDQHFLYWDAIGDGIEKGKSKTIIDFIIEHIIPQGKFDYLFIVNYLERYLNSGQSISLETSKFTLSKKKTYTSEEILDLPLRDLKDDTYLRERGISKEIILDPIFYSTIKEFKEVIQIKNESNTKTKTYINKYLGFVLVNEKGIAGINLKKKLPSGQKFQKILGNKESTLYLSRANSKTKNYEEFFICESTEDAMAYHQIIKNKKPDNFKIRYCATSGQVTNSQCEKIERQSEIYDINRFVLANDKDVSGAYYNAKILSLVNLKGIETTGLVFQCFKSNKSNYITIFYNKNENIISLSKILKIKSNILNSKEFKSEITPLSEFITEIKISFLASWSNWNTITDLILKLKFKDTKNIEIRIPKNDDWNQDLLNLINQNI